VAATGNSHRRRGRGYARTSTVRVFDRLWREAGGDSTFYDCVQYCGLCAARQCSISAALSVLYRTVFCVTNSTTLARRRRDMHLQRQQWNWTEARRSVQSSEYRRKTHSPAPWYSNATQVRSIVITPQLRRRGPPNRRCVHRTAGYSTGQRTCDDRIARECGVALRAASVRICSQHL
jgi:hypothetical protein